MAKIDITPTMTSNTTPSPYVVSASTEYSSTYAAWRVLDVNRSTLWAASGENFDSWWQLNFGTKTKVTSITIQASSIELNCMPSELEVLGSDDGDSFTSIKSFSGLTWETTSTEHELDLGKAYNYSIYRIHMTANDASSRQHLGDVVFYYDEDKDVKLLIRSDSKIYNMISGALTEVTDTVDSTYISQNGLSITDINNNISLLPDTFSLLSNVDTPLNVKGMKSKSSMILSKSLFNTKIAQNIDKIYMNSTLDANSSIKVAFSIDNGSTWKTYKDGTFQDLSITIPIKEYSSLSSEELTQWNNAKSGIIENGIDGAVLDSVDFNSLEFDTIRFAYVLSVTNIDDTCTLLNSSIQYDEKPSYKRMADSEISVQLFSTYIKVTPTISNELIKINILT